MGRIAAFWVLLTGVLLASQGAAARDPTALYHAIQDWPAGVVVQEVHRGRFRDEVSELVLFQLTAGDVYVALQEPARHGAKLLDARFLGSPPVTLEVVATAGGRHEALVRMGRPGGAVERIRWRLCGLDVGQPNVSGRLPGQRVYEVRSFGWLQMDSVLGGRFSGTWTTPNETERRVQGVTDDEGAPLCFITFEDGRAVHVRLRGLQPQRWSWAGRKAAVEVPHRPWEFPALALGPATGRPPLPARVDDGLLGLWVDAHTRSGRLLLILDRGPFGDWEAWFAVPALGRTLNLRAPKAAPLMADGDVRRLELLTLRNDEGWEIRLRMSPGGGWLTGSVTEPGGMYSSHLFRRP